MDFPNNSTGNRSPQFFIVNLQGQKYFHNRRVPINEGQMVSLVAREGSNLVVACNEINFLLVDESLGLLDEVANGKERKL